MIAEKLKKLNILTSKCAPKRIIAALNTVFSENEIPSSKNFNLLENKLFIIKPSKIAIAIDPKDTNFEK